MKNKIIAALLITLSILSTTACKNSDSEDATSTNPYITESSIIEEYKQQEISDLLKIWAFSYSTHDFLQYNDCVSMDLEFPDNSEFDQPYTANYFDTVTACEILDIDFENAQTNDKKIYTVPVQYSITYNEDFKEENGLKQGKNIISAIISIQENSAGSFFICSIENNIE